MLSQDEFAKGVQQLFRDKKDVHRLCSQYSSISSQYEIWSTESTKEGIGILVLQYGHAYFLAKYSQTRIKPDVLGRTKPIVCDLCFTRLPGSAIALTTFSGHGSRQPLAWLCCKDFRCSFHTRELTDEAINSKRQLGENTTVNSKTARLNRHIQALIKYLGLQPKIGGKP